MSGRSSGVSKTSIAKSIAEAIGQIYRITWRHQGESEIRVIAEHVGAMAGRIMQGISHVNIDNLCLLDEIDKLGHDFRGDPSSALLEVLDRNKTIVSVTIMLRYRTICPMFHTSLRQIRLKEYRCHCLIAWS